MVRGMTVDYQPESIRQVIGGRAKPRNAENWVLKRREQIDLDAIVFELCVPGTEWKKKAGTNEPMSFPASSMNRYARAWNLFMCANILPSSHSHEVTVERAILLYGILTEKYIDLGYVINKGILKFLRGGTTGAIPYGAVVMKLCRAVGVRWPESEQLQMPAAPIDHSTISRLNEWDGGVPHPKGVGYVFDDIVGGRPDPPVRSEEDAACPSRPRDDQGFSDTQYRRLARRMDAMHDIHRQFAQDLTQALGTAFRATGVEVDWPVFGAGIPYPPPDSPPVDEEEEEEFSDSE